MTAIRSSLGALGVLLGVYGAYLLLSRQDLEQLISAAIWLGAGVAVHDGLIALLGLVVVAIGARLLPVVARPAAAVGLIVLGSVTILAIPMLGRFGAKDDNPTLLDRSYWLGWSGIVVAVLVVVAVATVMRARRHADPAAGRVPTEAPGGSRDGEVDAS
ncbi:MAG: hypothetical protein WB471_15525 [Nocardioides sp.]